MIAPALLEHVSEQNHKEAAVLKERRKLREERGTARAAAGVGATGRAGVDASALQSTIDKQKNEIRKLKEQLAGLGSTGGKKGDKGTGKGARDE